VDCDSSQRSADPLAELGEGTRRERRGRIMMEWWRGGGKEGRENHPN